MIRTGCDLGIFTTLAASETPVSVEQLAAPHGAEHILLSRILKYLASIRMIKETSRDHFAANNATKALANPSIQGAMYYM